MNILDTLFKKKGIKTVDELNSEEKKTYDELREALQGRKLTDEDVKEFLDYELSNAVSRLTDINLSKEDEIFRKVEVRLIKKIKVFLNMPEMEKKLAEKQIEAQLK
jgi:hypothetical protein